MLVEMSQRVSIQKYNNCWKEGDKTMQSNNDKYAYIGKALLSRLRGGAKRFATAAGSKMKSMKSAIGAKLKNMTTTAGSPYRKQIKGLAKNIKQNRALALSGNKSVRDMAKVNLRSQTKRMMEINEEIGKNQIAGQRGGGRAQSKIKKLLLEPKPVKKPRVRTSPMPETANTAAEEIIEESVANKPKLTRGKKILLGAGVVGGAGLYGLHRARKKREQEGDVGNNPYYQ